MDRDALLVDTDDFCWESFSKTRSEKTSSGEAEARVSISNDPGNKQSYLPTERSKARSRGVLR
jgi:hypothetical protein